MMNTETATDKQPHQSDTWMLNCPNCGEKDAISYRPEVLTYECPHCHQDFTAQDLIQHTRRLKQHAKLSRARLLLIGALIFFLLALIPLLTVRLDYNEANNEIDFTAPGVQILLKSRGSAGPELQFYLIGQYMGRWQLSPAPAIEPEPSPTTTPTPEDDSEQPTRPVIPRPATLDSA